MGGRIYHETHYAPMLRMQGIGARDRGRHRRRQRGAAAGARELRPRPRREGAPRLVRTTVFDATERKLYERELLAARDRERVGARADRAPPADHRRARGGAGRTGDRLSGNRRAGGGSRRRARRRGRPRSRDRELRILVGQDGAGHVGGRGVRRGRGRRGRRVGSAAARRGRPAVARVRWKPPLRARRAPVPHRLRRADGSRAGAPAALEATRDVAHSLQRSLLAGAPPRDSRSRSRPCITPPSSISRSGATGTTPSGWPAAGSASSSGTWSAAASSRRARWASCGARSARSPARTSSRPRCSDTSTRSSSRSTPRATRRSRTPTSTRTPEACVRVGWAPAAGHARRRRRAPALHGRPLAATRRHRPGTRPLAGRVRSHRAPASCSIPTGWSSAGPSRSTPASSACSRPVRARPGRSPAQLVETLPAALLERDSASDDVWARVRRSC